MRNFEYCMCINKNTTVLLMDDVCIKETYICIHACTHTDTHGHTDTDTQCLSYAHTCKHVSVYIKTTLINDDSFSN